MKLLPYTIIVLLFGLLACEPDQVKITSDSSAKLYFSTDTVLFDTVLTIRSSISKRFRIYNPNKNAVNIDRIYLGQGRQSKYSMIVNGKVSTKVDDLVVYGGDSLLVIVNADIDYQNEDLPYLVKDSIVVEWGQYSTHVKLVAWGQDGVNYVMSGDTLRNVTWTNQRPYVIYGYVLVDTLASLTMLPGTNVYIDNGSSIYVKGSLKILGDSGNHVTISNTRFDEDYKEAPGQWGALFFLEGSKDNQIHYADIQNGTIGLRVGTPDEDDIPDVTVSHTTIRHMSQAGILAFTSDIQATNMLIYNVGTYMVGHFAGGNYLYDHCTFVNSPSFFINDSPELQFADNLVLSDDELLTGDLKLHITNSILWSSADEVVLISGAGGSVLDTLISNNIIRSKKGWSGNYSSIARNYPGFADPFVFDFGLDSLSFARDKSISDTIATDITGKPRDEKPDIGAFERFDGLNQ